MVEVVKKAIKENPEEDIGWFMHSENASQPLIQRRNQLLSKAREESGENETLRQIYHNAKSSMKNAVAMVKGNQIKYEVNKIILH